MTVKKLENSNVWYGPRVGYSVDEMGSQIGAEALFVQGEKAGRVRVHFQVGNLRGYKIQVYLDPHDFRTMLDLMVDADRSTAFREMLAVMADALTEN